MHFSRKWLDIVYPILAWAPQIAYKELLTTTAGYDGSLLYVYVCQLQLTDNLTARQGGSTFIAFSYVTTADYVM